MQQPLAAATSLDERCRHELERLKRHYRRLLSNYKDAVARNACFHPTGAPVFVTILFTDKEMWHFIDEYVQPFLKEYGLTAEFFEAQKGNYQVLLMLART